MSEGRINNLSREERLILLKLARQAVEAAAANKPLPRVELEKLPPRLRENSACFVTLHKHGELRGCTGILVAQAPLATEVVRTAEQTALHDPRFYPVRPEEVPLLDIEISILTPPQPLHVSNPNDLPKLIRPGIDGVTLTKGPYRATFLPQVWDHIPDPVHFLDMLCQKMGLYPQAWRLPGMQVEVYQVEEFSESSMAVER
jgi:AmmeMemoRadiSam system protein A